MPTFELEKTLNTQNYKNICGVDEVGRGPWAGPVMACAVILQANNLPLEAKDSKKLSPKKREEIFTHIIENAQVGIGEASVAEIDTYNIREATFMAMQRAIANLPTVPDYALIDGNCLPKNLPCPAQCIIKGDDTSLSIAAASIVAKVTRDRLMTDLHRKFPHFGWNTNAGYGTKIHQEGLAEVGINEHHRRSFKPIQKFL